MVISVGMVTGIWTGTWGRLNKIADDAGAPQLNVPCSFMQSLVCLPHAC